jgi:hypothetical protein
MNMNRSASVAAIDDLFRQVRERLMPALSCNPLLIMIFRGHGPAPTLSSAIQHYGVTDQRGIRAWADPEGTAGRRPRPSVEVIAFAVSTSPARMPATRLQPLMAISPRGLPI